MIKDLLTDEVVSAMGIDKNKRMVIKPLGAMYKIGNNGIRSSSKMPHLTNNITKTIPDASGKVSKLNNSSVLIKKPNKRKKSVLTKNAASDVSSFNFVTS